HWPGMRHLRGVITSPSMRPDGSLICEPGHDEATGLLYVPRVAFPPVPLEPTDDQIRDAVAALKDPLVDFPFSSDADRAACLALVLSIVGRPAIEGVVPLFAFVGNTRGVGKGLLCTTLVTAATGRQALLIPSVPPNNAEW